MAFHGAVEIDLPVAEKEIQGDPIGITVVSQDGKDAAAFSRMAKHSS
jgi:hypothetical protein